MLNIFQVLCNTGGRHPLGEDAGLDMHSCKAALAVELGWRRTAQKMTATPGTTKASGTIGRDGRRGNDQLNGRKVLVRGGRPAEVKPVKPTTNGHEV